MVQQKNIWVINGPNLNLLGQRETPIYGTATLREIEDDLQRIVSSTSYSLQFHQSNHEGHLIDWIQAAREDAGLIINAGGLTHTSISLYDALKAIDIPKIEVHLSNIYARESFRHQSLISPAVHAVVAGMGRNSYTMALDALINYYLKPI
jgi:3-dehydroquinate dehydratase II